MAERLIIDIVFQGAADKRSLGNAEKIAGKSGKKAGAEYSKGFKKGTATINTSNIFRSIGKSALGATAGILGISAALRQVGQQVTNLRQFTRGIAEVNSILPRNAKLTEESTQKLIEFSAQFGSDSTKQAKAFYNIVSAGVKTTAKQLNTLAIANKAAVAGLVDIDDAAKVIVSSVNAYSQAGLTAADASDKLFVAVREGQTTFGELTDTLGNTTSIAFNAGVSFSELAGALAFVTKSGIKTDVAVTGLRQIFASVISPTKEATDTAKALGLEFTTSAIKAKGLAGFLRDVQVATGGNTKTLSKLFGNIRALAPILNIVNGNFKDFERILKETQNAQGATASAFDDIADSLDFSIDRATSEFSAFGLNLFSILIPALKQTARTASFAGEVLNSIFTVESTKPLDIINAKLGETGREFNNIKNKLKEVKAFPQKTVFGGLSASGKAAIDLTEKLKSLGNTRVELLQQRSEILRKSKVNDKSETESNQNKNDNIIASNQALNQQLRLIGLNKFEILQIQEDDQLALLNQGFEAKLLSETDFENRKFAVNQQFSSQRQALLEQEQLKADATFSNISTAFGIHARNMKVTAGSIAKTMLNLAVNGFGRSFQLIGQAVRQGDSIGKAFEAGMKQTFADVASAAGDFYIKLGIASIASQNYAVGAAEIAAGAGLKTLSGFLGASSGGGGGGGGGAGASATTASVADTSQFSESFDSETEFEERTNVNLVVQGPVFNTEETARSLVDLFNDNFDKTGAVLTGARLA